MHIDSEVYFWKNEKAFRDQRIRENKILQQQYLPEQISLSLHRNEINGCIAVVGETAEVETRFLAELALTHSEIRGVIGWIDLSDSNAPEKILAFQQYAPIRGYKLELGKQTLPSAAVMELLGTCQYSLDLSGAAAINPDSLITWLNHYPDMQFVIPDCGDPDARQAPSKNWETRVRELAKNQNLSCKLSGLFTRGNRKSWKPADFYPFLDILFDAFGSDRILFASGWPFLLLSGIYVQWKSLVEKFMEKFPIEYHDKIFGENAERIYHL
jgi:L-fuconolactonase